MEKTFIFDFGTFVNDIRQNEEEKKMVVAFEHHFGNLDGQRLEHMPFYKDYLSKIEIPSWIVEKLDIPYELKDDFDYELLLRLVAGSFSSSYVLIYDAKKDQVTLRISVSNGNTCIEKNLQELWSFQIERLFEIYITEQMNLTVLTKEKDDEKTAIEMERKVKLLGFSKKVESLQRKKGQSIEYENSQKDFHDFISQD